jgi:hypothetical protein
MPQSAWNLLAFLITNRPRLNTKRATHTSMKDDFTRRTLRKRRRGEVNMQQGRTKLDADWNESTGIKPLRFEALAHGSGGKGSASGNGFRLGNKLGGKTLRHNFSIQNGRYYVDGIPCENDDVVTYTSQPYLSFPGGRIPEDGGIYIAYLDVWERYLTLPDDSRLTEDALTGPDTTTRTFWQVKILPLTTKDGVPSPKRAHEILEKRFSTVKPGLRFHKKPHDTNDTNSTPQNAYRNQENRLYRVEIHDSSSKGRPQLSSGRGIMAQFPSPPRASTATATLPQDGEKATLVPLDGIRHHYGPLALLKFSSKGISSVVRDYRAHKIH